MSFIYATNKEGILLLIRRLTATFGGLRDRTLTLSDGLNIIQAPNEAGKSTWCAFLLSMLYGINSRERDRAGFIADKNRYAPWSGAAMSGRMDCLVNGRELTLTRTTRRQTAPLGEFQAVYAGTGDAVPNLTGTACGETLLGVSREVLERSAFIRQSGLPVSQDPGLERRIAALITSGEEDVSYTEAADALKKQLNRRRHNKTGLLPTLEAEQAETVRQIREAEALEAQLLAARAEAEQLEAQVAELSGQLEQLDRWEAAQANRELEEAQARAAEAETQAQTLRQQLQSQRIPENDTIGRLRGAIVNLATVRKSVDKARAERDEAMKQLLKAEATVAESPFAGQSPDSARKEAASPPTPAGWRKGPGLALITLGTLTAFILFYVTGTALSGSPWQKPAALAVLLAILGITYFLAGRLRRRAIQEARSTALMKRFGTADVSAITALADTYCKLYEARDAAQAEVNAKTATADALYASLTSNEQAILLEVRRFAPSAFDLAAADQLLRGCAVRRRELAEAEAAAKEAALRRDLLARQAPAAPETDVPAPAVRDREVLTARLAAAQARSADARSAADHLAGRLHAAGDPVVLRSAQADLEQRTAELEAEYDALALAMEVLDEANTDLRSRFSPALGRRTAEIFSALTGGRYDAVVLDRSFRLSAQPSGAHVYRDAGFLSAGTADQLYLAVRLAICDLVLPPETKAPLVLDDALSNFDDLRCEAALRYLKEAAKQRQILLFTCHSREAAFFAGDREVSIQRLTDRGEEV